MSRRKSHPFRVFIEQVNQTYVDVNAKTPEKAAVKGYRKWKRDQAHSRVMAVERKDFKP